MPAFLVGPEVTMGHSFSITCILPPESSRGIFYLTFSSSNSSYNMSAVGQSASFDFPADCEHQGNYSCVYEGEVSGQKLNFTSELMAVTIKRKQAELTLKEPMKHKGYTITHVLRAENESSHKVALLRC